MFRFETLEIWRLSIAYGKRLYKVADKFPKTEIFALVDQLKRAAVSISNNIAEGSGGSNKDFANFLNISVKSILETVNILHFALELGYIDIKCEQEHYADAENLIKRVRAFRKLLLSKP